MSCSEPLGPEEGSVLSRAAGLSKPVQWSPDLVERFWSGLSQTRLSELSFSRHNADHLLELAAAYLKPGGRHLDFGSGDGDLVRALLGRGYPTAAYEPASLRALKMPGEVASHPRFLGLVGGDEPERFDVVFMVEVIEHILDACLDDAFDRVRSLLAVDGLLIVTAPLAEDLELGSAYCPSCGAFFHRWQHLRSFTPESLDAFLSRYGFRRVASQQVDFSHHRIVVEELRRMDEEISALYGRLARSFGARVKRLLTGRSEERTTFPKASLTGTPTHLFYVGRPA
jgi:SAM-dependent methyltransferase